MLQLCATLTHKCNNMPKVQCESLIRLGWKMHYIGTLATKCICIRVDHNSDFTEINLVYLFKLFEMPRWIHGVILTQIYEATSCAAVAFLAFIFFWQQLAHTAPL